MYQALLDNYLAIETYHIEVRTCLPDSPECSYYCDKWFYCATAHRQVKPFQANFLPMASIRIDQWWPLIHTKCFESNTWFPLSHSKLKILMYSPAIVCFPDPSSAQRRERLWWVTRLWHGSIAFQSCKLRFQSFNRIIGQPLLQMFLYSNVHFKYDEPITTKNYDIMAKRFL